MKSQLGFFDLEDRYAQLSKAGNPLETFERIQAPLNEGAKVPARFSVARLRALWRLLPAAHRQLGCWIASLTPPAPALSPLTRTASPRLSAKSSSWPKSWKCKADRSASLTRCSNSPCGFSQTLAVYGKTTLWLTVMLC